MVVNQVNPNKFGLRVECVGNRHDNKYIIFNGYHYQNDIKNDSNIMIIR